ncbi:MAG: purine-nucleoside phosphorylase [Desulfuromonas sp.]|nr:purine-nucleoside phosphorylase [Desulfuromonas sp.]
MIQRLANDEPELQSLLEALNGCKNCDTAIILGSGLDDWAERFPVECSLPYADFSALGQLIEGQRGQLLVVTFEGRRLLVFQGRLHLYQGLSAWQAALPVRLAHAMGCQRVLLSNAVGGIADGFAPGDFMLIEDHLNLQGDNPLRGIQPSPFIDLCQLYEQRFFPALLDFARAEGIRLHKGVLAALVGPSYETAAEIRVLQRLGADVASMSTVPEAIMARYLGLDVAGLSLITNYAAGRSPQALSHAEVLECAAQARQPFQLLIDKLLRLWMN